MDQACSVMERPPALAVTMPDHIVFITVVGGVAYVDYVPPGVTVSVTDYDVDTRFQTASTYEVSRDTVLR